MKCPKHPRYKGGVSPEKRKDAEGRTCRECWIMHYTYKDIPYNPTTLRSLAKVHTRYYQQSGKQVQGITTVIGNHNGDKGGMVYAAWKLGCEGLDYKEEWKQKADTGTIAHEMIRAHLLDIDYYPTRLYGDELVDQALVAFQGFLEWKGGFKQFETIFIEKPFVSEELPYGFTLDWYGILDGLHTAVDFKTGKAVYWNHKVQLAGIVRGLREHGYPVDQRIILHIKKGEESVDGTPTLPEFQDHPCPNLTDEVRWFEIICRANPYYLRVAKGWK